MNTTLKGSACGVIAAVAYGTNPLFSLNLFAEGMDVESVLFYRFALAAAFLAVVLPIAGVDLAPRRRELLPIVFGGLAFALSSQMLYQSFLYMDAGVACAILFVYPILVAVIMALFFHEKPSPLTFACIAVALAGVALLYLGDGSGPLSPVGMLLVAVSSLCYAVYIVGVDHSPLRLIPSAKLTFWVLAVGAAMFLTLASLGHGVHPIAPNAHCIANVVGIALVPTIGPILFINVAIKLIGPTLSAIIGALEPVTALAIGVLVFGESLTPRMAAGASLILIAVIVVVARPLLRRALGR